MDKLSGLTSIIVDLKYAPQNLRSKKAYKEYRDQIVSGGYIKHVATARSTSQLNMISDIIEAEGYRCEVIEDKNSYHLFAGKPKSEEIKLDLKL